MRSIKFSESELEFLRERYKIEIEAAENYIIQAKEILKKLGSTKKPSIDIIPEKAGKVRVKRGRKPGKKATVDTIQKPSTPPKKRGRKPKFVSTEESTKPSRDVPAILEKKKPFSKLKKAPEKKIEPSIQKTPDLEPKTIIPSSPKVEKPIVRKKRANKRTRKGIFLAPLSKPLKKKEPSSELQPEPAPPAESPKE
jgi:hypothetical protein